MYFRGVIVSTLLLALTGCGNLGFRDGGPNHSFNPDSVAEIEPRVEPLSRGGNPDSYSQSGKTYRVLKSNRGFTQQGGASWYGTKFHGRKTSNGERYDMYAISAAHKTLPIPTYLEVTNLENGRRLIVRVNDRGPFHSERIIDLSYAAAAKLGYADKGTTQVKIRAIDVAQYQREKLRTTPSHNPTQVITKPLQIPVTAIAVKATALPVEIYAERAEKIAPTPHSVDGAGSTPLPIKGTPEPAIRQPIYIQLGAFTSRTNAELMIKQSSNAKISKIAVATIQPVTRDSGMVYRVRLGPFSNKNDASEILQQLIEKNIGDPRIFHGS